MEVPGFAEPGIPTDLNQMKDDGQDHERAQHDACEAQCCCEIELHILLRSFGSSSGSNYSRIAWFHWIRRCHGTFQVAHEARVGFTRKNYSRSPAAQSA